MLDRYTSMQAFIAVVRAGTFAGAAADLGLSRAMVTRHIKALENHLGVRLFNRTTRSTRLTEAGQRYFERLGDILAELEALEGRLTDDAAGVRGVLALAAPPLFGALLLAPVVDDFMRACPEVRVRMTLTDRHVDLVDEGIDVAISVGDLVDSSNIARRLTAVAMVVCASPDYLARHGTPAEPGDLGRHNCLLFAEQPAHHRAAWAFMAGREVVAQRVEGDFVSNAGDALRRVATRGRGIVRLPRYIVAEDLAAGRLRAILEAYRPPLRPVHALYAHRQYVPGKIRSFLDFAQAAFARLRLSD